MTERISVADYRAEMARKKGTKRVVGAEPTVVDGIKFDSAREAKRWQELRLMEMAGEISELTRQVPLELQGMRGPILTPKGRVRRYIADFRYLDRRTGAWVIEDSKGHPTEVYELKKAIVAAMGLEVIEV